MEKVLVLATACLLLIAGGVWSVELPEKSDAEPLKWWQEEIVYQIYPRSHQDTNGDGTGDLAGIEKRLDHFEDIGVGSVWISPIYKSPMKDFGYDISDFRNIDPTFGTMANFDSMSAAMKAKNIKLIMDFVPNHSSDQHMWFQESLKGDAGAEGGKYKDYYVWREKSGDNPDGTPKPPNNWLSVFGGSAWEWRNERQEFYLHQFTKEQPDLNFANEAVVGELMAIFKFWVDKGVDGFRVDAVPHIFEKDFDDEAPNPDAPRDAHCDPLQDYICLIHDKTYNLPETFPLLRRIRTYLDILGSQKEKELVMMVEATVPGLDNLFKYYGTEDEPIAHYPFNFEFINRIPTGFKGTDIEGLLVEWFAKMPEGKTANWLLGNHDNHRVASRFGEERVDALNMINLLLPGSAVTYYGEEIGMLDTDISFEDTVDPPGCGAGRDRYKEFSRDPERTPMQWNGTEKNAGFSTAAKTWLPMNPNFPTVNVVHQWASEEMTHIKVYKKIVDLRKTDVWRYGSLQSASFENDELFGFTRIYKDQGFLLLTNFGSSLKLVDLQQTFANIPLEAYAYLTSVGYQPDIELGSERRTDAVAIYPNHAIILQWNVSDLPTDPPTSPTSPTPSTTTPTTTSTTRPTTTPRPTNPSSGNPGSNPSSTSTQPPTTTDGAPKNSFSFVMIMLTIFSVVFAVIH